MNLNLNEINIEAKAAAKEAALNYFNNKMDGQCRGACGFAWVNIYEYDGKQIKGSTKIGRALKEAGVEQDYNRVFTIWNPSGLGVQSVEVLEAGAKAAAEVFKKYGFKAYGCSRLD